MFPAFATALYLPGALISNEMLVLLLPFLENINEVCGVISISETIRDVLSPMFTYGCNLSTSVNVGEPETHEILFYHLFCIKK